MDLSSCKLIQSCNTIGPRSRVRFYELDSSPPRTKPNRASPKLIKVAASQTNSPTKSYSPQLLKNLQQSSVFSKHKLESRDSILSCRKYNIKKLSPIDAAKKLKIDYKAKDFILASAHADSMNFYFRPRSLIPFAFKKLVKSEYKKRNFDFPPELFSSKKLNFNSLSSISKINANND